MAFPPSDNGKMRNICLVIPSGSFKKALCASFSREGWVPVSLPCSKSICALSLNGSCSLSSSCKAPSSESSSQVLTTLKFVEAHTDLGLMSFLPMSKRLATSYKRRMVNSFISCSLSLKIYFHRGFYRLMLCLP